MQFGPPFRLEYFDIEGDTSLKYILYIELCTIFSGFPIYISSLYVASKTRFHRNLKTLIICGFSLYFIGTIPRILLILAMLNFIPTEEDPQKDQLLIICSYIRQFFYGAITMGINAIYLERRCATYFIRDYERNRRAYISYSLILFIIVFSGIVGFTILSQILELYVLTIIGVVHMLYILLRFNLLYKKNKRRLSDLNGENSNTSLEYTLSMRFQLEENIRTLNLIRFGFISVACFFLLCSFFLIISKVFLYGTWTYYVLEACLNLLIAGLANFFPPLTALLDPVYMRTVKQLPIVGHIFWLYRLPAVREPSLDEGVVYFASLEMQWNFPPSNQNRSSKRKKKSTKVGMNRISTASRSSS